MPLGDFAEPGTTLKPLVIGRATRLAFAVGLGFLFALTTITYADNTSSDFPLSTYWIGVVYAWWYVSQLVAIGFGLRWGRWTKVAVLPAALGLVVIDLVVYGEVWHLPLAWGVFLFTEFVLAYFSISFFLAAILAVPG